MKCKESINEEIFFLLTSPFSFIHYLLVRISYPYCTLIMSLCVLPNLFFLRESTLKGEDLLRGELARKYLKEGKKKKKKAWL